MDRKQSSDHEAAANISGGALQHPEQQGRVESVQQKIDVVMSGRIEAEHIAVERVRYPAEGNPVHPVHGGERPLDGVPCQAVVDVRIVHHIEVIVESEEGMRVSWRVKTDDNQCQHRTQHSGTGRRIGLPEKRRLLFSHFDNAGAHCSSCGALSELPESCRRLRRHDPHHVQEKQRFKRLAIPALGGRHILQHEEQGKDGDSHRNELKTMAKELPEIRQQGEQNQGCPHPPCHHGEPPVPIRHRAVRP